MSTNEAKVVNRKTVFLEIKALTEAACRLAYSKRTLAVFKNEPVNWADLGCTGVEWYQNDTDHRGFRVYIEEAAPDCAHLSAFIANYLQERGYSEVDVVTEW
jgi:hypothetical protein